MLKLYQSYTSHLGLNQLYVFKTDTEYKTEFEEFINNPKTVTNPDGCLDKVLAAYKMAEARYNNGTDFMDPNKYDAGYVDCLEQQAEDDENLSTLMNSLSATAQHFIENYDYKLQGQRN